MKNTAINYYGKSYVINGRNTITILTIKQYLRIYLKMDIIL